MSYKTHPSDTHKMPGGIPYIISNEAAERFSFYGMKAALVIFMSQYLHLMGKSPDIAMSKSSATEYAHYFVMFCYATPLLGALISDALWGKYRTIITLSIVYCLGHAALAFVGITGSPAIWLISGLGLISIGSGGIKPCVSAHVGDQFGKNNAHLITKTFNYFYLSINLGAAISNVMIPWVLKWYGPHLAFGLPGILMALATLLFWMGRRKFIHVPAGGKTFLHELFSGTGLRAIGKLSIIFLFVAVFWALFDQTATSWVFQAQDMDRNLLGIELLPSQIQAANPILILILIPIFTFVLYPAVSRITPFTPLRKIGAGLFIMVIAFGLVSYAQSRIDAGFQPSIIWQLLGYILLTCAEIMVSIVCLEFAYTQAPRNMKSLVMSLYLLAVALGNFFAAQVNHHIQTPSPIASALEKYQKTKKPTIHFAGYDETMGTPDDITVHIKNATIGNILVPGKDALNTATEKIRAWSAANKTLLPTTETGQKLISHITDPWGQTLHYTLQNRHQCRIASNGPDLTPKTQWDTGIILKKPTQPTPSDPSFTDSLHSETDWLTRRKAELNVQPDSADASKNHHFYAGGQDTLEGAEYFWFFTKLMLITALIFIPVSIFYKEKTYMQQ